jgi:xylulokinase
MLMKKYLLGFDVGSLSSKGILVDCDGKIAAKAQREHIILCPVPGGAEHDAENNWWGDFKAIVKEMLSFSGIAPQQIAGIGITGLVPTLCPVGQDGKAVRNAILYSDNRAINELQEVNKLLKEPITLEQVLPKLLWYKRNEPANYRDTISILNPHSYLVFKLTGRFSCDVDTANIFGGIFASETGSWETEKCRSLGVNEELLPPAYPATAIIGEVTPEAAKQTGLVAGIPVIAGTGDSYTSLLGNGVIHPGEMMIYLGTAGTQIMCNRELEQLAATVHISDKGGAVEFGANVLSCGQALQWFKNEMAPPGFDYASLDEKAAAIPPGSGKLITLPHFMGRRAPAPNPLAKGVICGVTPNHSRHHFYRSLLESIAFGLKQGFEPVRAKAKRIVIAGGGAKSALWRQIISDVLDFPVEYQAKGGAALGIAYFAGFSLGLLPSFQTIQEEWLPVQEIIRPNPDNAALYQRYYQAYLELERSLETFYGQLQSL